MDSQDSARGTLSRQSELRLVSPTDARGSAADLGEQLSWEDLGTPLRNVTFCVVDLETTGGSPGDAGITEFGAVKVRDGEVLGEFQTLVNPGVPIPAFISVLTGISNAMVAGAPSLSTAMASFLEFSRGSVLVAHNAPYDISFLKGACAKLGMPWPESQVLDTAALARKVLTKDDVPNNKLATLAIYFESPTTPVHRALADAQATVRVLHGLIERVGNLGVTTLEDLVGYSRRITAAQRRKRTLSEGLPAGAGVYVFRDASESALYIGKSVNIRSRVRTYFTASEQRRRMTEMVALTERVDAIACATELEAAIREIRLIDEHKPRYNRRSKFPQRQRWITLTDEAYPRLSVVNKVSDDGRTYIGPCTRASADLVIESVHEAFMLRTCTTKIQPAIKAPSCVLGDVGKCLAPCREEDITDDYASIVLDVRTAITLDPAELTSRITDRMRELSADQRFEDAIRWRERLLSVQRVLWRTERLSALVRLPEVIAARASTDRQGSRHWEIHLVKHGVLAAAATVAAGFDPRPTIDSMRASAMHVDPAVPPHPAGLVEEAELILSWLESDGVRLVRVEGDYAMPRTMSVVAPVRGQRPSPEHADDQVED